MTLISSGKKIERNAKQILYILNLINMTIFAVMLWRFEYVLCHCFSVLYISYIFAAFIFFLGGGCVNIFETIYENSRINKETNKYS